MKTSIKKGFFLALTITGNLVAMENQPVTQQRVDAVRKALFEKRNQPPTRPRSGTFSLPNQKSPFGKIPGPETRYDKIPQEETSIYQTIPQFTIKNKTGHKIFLNIYNYDETQELDNRTLTPQDTTASIAVDGTQQFPLILKIHHGTNNCERKSIQIPENMQTIVINYDNKGDIEVTGQ